VEPVLEVVGRQREPALVHVRVRERIVPGERLHAIVEQRARVSQVHLDDLVRSREIAVEIVGPGADRLDGLDHAANARVLEREPDRTAERALAAALHGAVSALERDVSIDVELRIDSRAVALDRESAGRPARERRVDRGVGIAARHQSAGELEMLATGSVEQDPGVVRIAVRKLVVVGAHAQRATPAGVQERGHIVATERARSDLRVGAARAVMGFEARGVDHAVPVVGVLPEIRLVFSAPGLLPTQVCQTAQLPVSEQEAFAGLDGIGVEEPRRRALARLHQKGEAVRIDAARQREGRVVGIPRRGRSCGCRGDECEVRSE
jgi:hypothetical protein